MAECADHHPLGPPRRAGGEDDVRQVLRLHAARAGASAGSGGEVRPVQDVEQHGRTSGRAGPASPFRRQDEATPASSSMNPSRSARVRRVQRHVRARRP